MMSLSEHTTGLPRSPKIRAKAAKLFEEGHGYKYVARELNEPPSLIRDWGRLYRCGRFVINRSMASSRRLTNQQKQAILENVQAGLTYGEIAQKLDITPAQLRCFLRSYRAEHPGSIQNCNRC